MFIRGDRHRPGVPPSTLPGAVKLGALMSRPALAGALKGMALWRKAAAVPISPKKGELSLWEVQAIRQGGMVWGSTCAPTSVPTTKGPLIGHPGLYQNVVPILTRENLAVLKMQGAGVPGERVLERNLAIPHWGVSAPGERIGRKTPPKGNPGKTIQQRRGFAEAF